MKNADETKIAGQAAPAQQEETPAPAELPVERDRRGVVLPTRQRVGGIITPQ